MLTAERNTAVSGSYFYCPEYKLWLFFPGVDTWIYIVAKKVFLSEKQFGLPANWWEHRKIQSDWLTDDCFQKQWRIMLSSKIGIKDKNSPNVGGVS